MNKLLSRKVLALSMLALVVGESRGMQQRRVFALLNPTAQYSSMPHNLSSAKDLILKQCSPEQRGILLSLTDKEVHSAVFAYWVKKYKKFLHNEITIGCIWDFLAKLSNVKVVIEYICQNKKYGDLTVAGIKRQNPGLSTERCGFCQYRNARKKLLGEWDKYRSPAWGWLTKLGLIKRSANELVNLLESAACGCAILVNIPREARQDKFIFAKFLDDNWGVLQPFLGQITVYVTIPQQGH